MAIQRVAPDAIVTPPTAGLNGVVSAIQDDPDSFDGNWLTTQANTSQNTICRVRFGSLSPVGQLNLGAGLQNFRILLRKNASGGNTCQVSVFLYENGVLLQTLATAITVSSLTGAVTQVTWNASALSDPTGVNVEVRVDQTTGGTNSAAGNRRWVEIGAIEWNADYTATPVGFTTSLSLGAELYKSFTKASSLDALLFRSAATKTTSLNGVLGFNVQQNTVSFDAVTEDTFANTITTRPVSIEDDGGEELVNDSSDSLVLDEAEPLGPELDAALFREGDTVTIGLDGILVIPGTKTTSLDAGLFKSAVAKTTSLDGFAGKALSLDGFLQTGTTHFTVSIGDLFDALLVRTGLTKTTSFNAALNQTATNTLTLSMGGQLAGDFDEAVYRPEIELDAFLDSRNVQPVVDLDGFLFQWVDATQTSQGTWGVRSTTSNRWVAKADATAGFWDATGTGAAPTQPGDLVRTGEPTISLDAALIYEGVLGTVDFDADVAEAGQRTVSLDAELSKVARTTASDLDSWVYKQTTPTVSLHAFITGKSTLTAALSLDSALAAPDRRTRTITADAFLLGSRVRLDATLIPSVENPRTISTDAILFGTGVPTLRLAAALNVSMCGGVPLDSYLAVIDFQSATTSMGAMLLKTVSKTASLDASLIRATTVTKTMSMNSAVNGTRVKSASMNAVLVPSPAFSSDFSTAFDTSF